VDITAGVTVSVTGRTVRAKGKLGELAFDLPEGIEAAVDGGKVQIRRSAETPQTLNNHGTARSVIANMIAGVSAGYSRELEIQGVGFKAAIKGPILALSLGYPAPVEFRIPDGVKVAEEGGVKLVVSGVDKQKVGDVAARIRSFFPAEPYKGKGIRYKNEYVRRKVGKTVA
jgi:large subunit ribosomal protein L6